MARFLLQLWRSPPTAPVGVEAETLTLPFVTLATGALALPGLWPALAGDMARPIAEAGPAAAWPILLGTALAAAAVIDAHARRVGWAAFLTSLTSNLA